MGTGSVPHTPNVETITIKSLPNLIEKVCLQTSAGYLWRGQTDNPDYKLRPGIFRKEADWKLRTQRLACL